MLLFILQKDRTMKVILAISLILAAQVNVQAFAPSMKGTPCSSSALSLNKSELADSIATGTDLSNAQAGDALDAILKGVEDTLVSGDMVVLQKFGVFRTRVREAREGRNPKTGEKLSVEKAILASFSPHEALKDALN